MKRKRNENIRKTRDLARDDNVKKDGGRERKREQENGLKENKTFEIKK